MYPFVIIVLNGLALGIASALLDICTMMDEA